MLSSSLIGSAPSVALRKKKALEYLGVAIVCFAAVAGGPYGIEPAVGQAGGLPTLLCLFIVAISWACTQALMVAELSTMLPSNAGYIGWVLHGLGPVCGFVNAWVCNLQQILNIPLYAVLACNSLEQLSGQLSPAAEYFVKFGVVAIAGTVNIFGVGAVERVTGVMVVLVQTPFILMPIVWAAYGGRKFQWAALGQTVEGWEANLAGFQATVCWNLQGWNVIGNIAGEVEDPTFNIPAGVALAVGLTTLNYIWPLAFTVPMSPPPSPPDDPTVAGARWGPGYFAGLAAQTSPVVGAWAAVCAVLSCTSNFIPMLATSSRALQATARMAMVPGPAVIGEWLAWEDPQRGTPMASVFLILGAVLGLMVLNFNTLVTTQILLALVGLSLQFAAFIRLKYAAPHAKRPYAVPFGTWGAWALALPFFALAGVITFSAVTGGTQNWVSCLSVLAVSIGFALAGHFWWVKGGHYNPERVAKVLALGDGNVEGGALEMRQEGVPTADEHAETVGLLARA